MSDGREFRFRIDAFTPETIPMDRLAEYMADVAKVLGESANVHFVRLEKGSTVLVQTVEEEAVPKVRDRIRRVGDGTAPNDALAAYRRANNRLLADNATGSLLDHEGAQIIRFPGREQAEPLTFGAFNQDGSLDGQLIRLGGTGDQVPVHLQTADRLYTHCFASRELARVLGQYIFGPEMRVFGTGRWSRDKLGNWNLDRFTIGRFELLDDEALSAVVARLRDVPGNDWKSIDDPWSELGDERDGSDEIH